MATSGNLSFKYILQVALGDQPKVFTERQIQRFKEYLDCNILSCRIANLNVGLDHTGVQTPRQRDSLNHSVLYLNLGDSLAARFSMESAMDSKKGKEAPGVLAMKFQNFKGISWKELKSLSRPWLNEKIPTLRHLMIFMDLAKLDNFIMSAEALGCRNFMKGYTRILIECHSFDLNMSDEEFKWGPITTRGNLKPHELSEEIARLSLPRLEQFFEYYYTSHGDKRVVTASDGRFAQELKHGKKIMHEYSNQLPYLLPKGVPGAADEES